MRLFSKWGNQISNEYEIDLFGNDTLHTVLEFL